MQFTCMSGEVGARELWVPFIGKEPTHSLAVGVSIYSEDA